MNQTIIHLSDGTAVVVDGGVFEARAGQIVIAHKGANVKGAKGAVLIALAGSSVSKIDETYLVALAGATVDGDLLDDLALNPVDLPVLPQVRPEVAERINAWVRNLTKGRILQVSDAVPSDCGDANALVILYDGETFVATMGGCAEVSAGRIGIALPGGLVKALSGSTAIALPSGSVVSDDNASVLALPGAHVNGVAVVSFTVVSPK